jgi:hypothetical protein
MLDEFADFELGITGGKVAVANPRSILFFCGIMTL